MISLQEAWEILHGIDCQLRSEVVPVEDSRGRRVSQDVRSPIDVAPFRNSAMDGFAVNSKRLKSFPARLRVAATVYAGDEVSSTNDNAESIKVMTGAVVPDAFDTVVPIEDVEYAEPFVTLSSEPKAGQHIRMPGEDVAKGERMLSKGDLIGPFELGVLVSLGIDSIECFRRPRVLLVSTGDELLQPGESLRTGKVYDSNSFTVSSMINGYCHSIDRLRCHADDLPLLVETLDTDHDLVITSGGVSAGEKDHVPVAVIKSGWEQQFHRVSIKPGKPALFATRNEQFLFGLPGNPLSAAVTCAVFILPLLKRMNGMESIDLLLDSALLVGHPFKSNRTIIWPGTIERTSSTATATYSSKRSSAALSALLKSDGLIFQNVSTEFSGEKVGVCDWSRIL